MNADGKYIYAVTGGGFLYRSLDFGVTWSTVVTTGMDAGVSSIAVSASGRYIVFSNIDSGLYISSDYGTTFVQKIVGNSSTLLTGVAISASGQFVSTCTATTSVFMISSNYGQTFTSQTYSPGSPFLTGICMSASGQYQLAYSRSSPSTNYIYRSSDYGKTWSDYYQNNQVWGAIAITPSGNRAFAVVSNGAVYRIYLDVLQRASILPDPDNALTLGTSSARWATIYAVNGTIQTSDSSTKDAVPLPYGLNEVVQMRTIKYKWKNQAELDDNDPAKNFEYYGFCADELAPLFPELVYNEDKDVPIQMNYSEILPVMVNAVKELKAENDALKANMVSVLDWLRNTQGVVFP
jgi:hypothetical protein